MKPKILSICGSPRKDGNTAVLLREALKGAGDAGAETEEIFFARLQYWFLGWL